MNDVGIRLLQSGACVLVLGYFRSLEDREEFLGRGTVCRLFGLDWTV